METPRLDFTFMEFMRAADPRSRPSLAEILGEAEDFLPEDPKELKTLVLSVVPAPVLDVLDVVANIAAKVYVQGRISKADRRKLGVLLDLPEVTLDDEVPQEEVRGDKANTAAVRREPSQQT